MKRFDFSHTGGFPLTQDRLAWMQEGYITALNALGGLAGGLDAVVLSGVELSSGSWAAGGTVSDGWIWHPQMGLMPFIGGAFTTTTKGVSYKDVFTALTFANNSNQNVQISRVAGIAPGSGNVLQSLSENRWGAAFGRNNRANWSAPVAPVANNSYITAGGLYWRYDAITDMAHIRGSITFNPPQQTPQLAAMITCFGPLPAAINPTNRNVPFVGACSAPGWAGLGLLEDSEGNKFGSDTGALSSNSPGAFLLFRMRTLSATLGTSEYLVQFDFNYLVH